MSVTLLGTALVLVFAPPAAEGAKPEVLDGVSFTDGVPKREQRSLREAFEQARDTACAARDRIGVRIGGDSRNYTLDWVASDPRLDAPLTRTATCELCSVVEVEEQIAADVGLLCSRLAGLDAEPGRVRVSTEPSGAVVQIDGRRRGRTPWVGEVPAGEHDVRVHARGYSPQVRTLQIVGGGIEEVEHFELMARPTAARPAWPGWTTLGLGVALGLAGSALIAVHGKEWQGRCTGDDVDASGNCRYVWATRPLGIGLAAAGAAAFAGGVGLIVWSQRGDTGGIVSGGVAVQGRF